MTTQNLFKPAAIAYLIASIFIFMGIKIAWADTADTLNATVKVSICGNGIIEGGEDCEGDNIGSGTCQNMGMGEGVLVCDIACSYDLSGCSPAPTRSPSISSNISQTPLPNTSASPQPIASASIKNEIGIFRSPDIWKALPLSIRKFDADGDDKINVQEVMMASKEWVKWWREYISQTTRGLASTDKAGECDLNMDNKCNLRDFSILLAYAE